VCFSVSCGFEFQDLTAKQLAEQFRTSETVVLAMMAQGLIKPLYILPISNEPRFSLNAYSDFISERLVSNPEQKNFQSVQGNAINANSTTLDNTKSYDEITYFSNINLVKTERKISAEKNLNSDDGLTVAFLQNYSSLTKVIDGYRGMSIRANKKSKVILFRDSKKEPYHELIKFPEDHKYADKDVDLLKNAHKRFLLRRESSLPWRDNNFLLGGEARKIETFNQLLGFYSESASKGYQTKIRRMKKRYFSGERGERKLSGYCRNQFIADYLNAPNSNRKPSDRNEVIKMINSAINKAKDDSNIQIDVQTLVRAKDRSYADKTDKIMLKLSTFNVYLGRAFKLKHYELCLSLIMQLLVLTRKTNTNKQTWEYIDFSQHISTVDGHNNKNRKLGRYLYPKMLNSILEPYKGYLSRQDWTAKLKDGSAKFLFESRKKAGSPVSSFDNQLNKVKVSLLADLESLDQSSSEFRSQYEEISAFTQHRLRDFADALLISVGATDNQKEKAAGRATSDVARGYENLTPPEIIKLKDRVVRLLNKSCPNFKKVKNGLIDSWKVEC